MADAQRQKDLEIYLRDHHAGATSALQLLEHLKEQHNEDRLGTFFSDLHADIAADQEQLQNLMEALGFEKSSVRDAGAWVAEKFTRAKLGFTAAQGANLRLFQALETLLIGVTGKRLLWCALEAAKDSGPVLQQTDLARLIDRAGEQARRIENERLKAARRAFGAA